MPYLKKTCYFIKLLSAETQSIFVFEDIMFIIIIYSNINYRFNDSSFSKLKHQTKIEFHKWQIDKVILNFKWKCMRIAITIIIEKNNACQIFHLNLEFIIK